MARYTARQLEKYLDELRRRGPHDSALVVITARSHPKPSGAVSRNQRWLGEIRWDKRYDGGLADLSFDTPEFGSGVESVR